MSTNFKTSYPLPLLINPNVLHPRLVPLVFSLFHGTACVIIDEPTSQTPVRLSSEMLKKNNKEVKVWERTKDLTMYLGLIGEILKVHFRGK